MSGSARRQSHCLPWNIPIYDNNIFSAGAGSGELFGAAASPKAPAFWLIPAPARLVLCAPSPAPRGREAQRGWPAAQVDAPRVFQATARQVGGTAPRPLSRRGGGPAPGADRKPGFASSPGGFRSFRRAPPARRRALETLLRQRIMVCLPGGLGSAHMCEVLQDGRVAPGTSSGVIASEQPLPGAAGLPAQQ